MKRQHPPFDDRTGYPLTRTRDYAFGLLLAVLIPASLGLLGWSLATFAILIIE